jgi:threonine/homoserine/homoserine lactone efflux protein
MDYHLLVFTLTVLVISLIPGLNVVFVISQSLHGGFRHTITSILGIITGNLIYLSISILGLGVITLQFPRLFEVIKYAGVAFTFYNAFKLVKAGLQRSESSSATAPVQNQQQFLQGVLTIVSNPKAFVFWITILPTFVHSQNNFLFQLGVFGVMAILIDTLVLAVYAYIASRASSLIGAGSANIQFTVSGLILGSVGVWLLFT